MSRSVSDARAEAEDDLEVSPRTDTGRTEAAALVGLTASFFAIAAGAALSTLADSLRWPALITFFASVSLAVWARRVVGSSAPRE